MDIGILALQGDVSEHEAAINAAMVHLGLQGGIVRVRRPWEMDGISALLMPGGESTTMAKQIDRFGLREPIIGMASSGKPIMGTCAGCILLASDIPDQVGQAVKPLGLIDISVRRNAFGRQADSFERAIEIDGLEQGFHGIFIRAPRIAAIGKGVESLAKLDGEHVMVRQGNIIALTFHPELTRDHRVHSMFLGMLRP